MSDGPAKRPRSDLSICVCVCVCTRALYTYVDICICTSNYRRVTINATDTCYRCDSLCHLRQNSMSAREIELWYYLLMFWYPLSFRRTPYEINRRRLYKSIAIAVFPNLIQAELSAGSSACISLYTARNSYRYWAQESTLTGNKIAIPWKYICVGA